MQPKIYSYQRISSKSQLKGTGLSQQRETPILHQLSEEHSLPISKEVFEDIGISAYKGNHLKASFGRILEAIQSKRIAKGSIIVISSLDRLSRQNVQVAASLFLEVLNAGVAIYTTMDNKLYEPNDEHAFTNVIMSVVYLERAHNESKTKSKRTTGNARTIINGILSNDPAFFLDGYTRAIKSVGSHPWWLDVSSNYVRPDETYFPIAQEIVARIINMESTVSITRWLRSNYPTPPRTRAKDWSPVLVDKMAINPMLTGARTLTIDDQTYHIPNYAPAVCTQKDYDLMRAVRAGKYKRDKVVTPKPTGLLNGINVLKCGICGGGMSANRTGKYIRYACINAANRTANHPQWGTPIERIEKHIVQRARVMAISAVTKPSTDAIRRLIADLAKANEQLSQLETEYAEYRADGIRVPKILVSEMGQLEDQIERLQSQIDEERVANASSILPNVWRGFFTDHAESDFLWLGNIELRSQLKNVLRHMVDSIVGTPTDSKVGNRKLIRWVIVWKDGTTEEVII